MKSLLTTIAITGLSLLALNHAHASKSRAYPSNLCIVTDNKLGSMGRVITKVHQGQEVKFCCKPCIKKFDKAPEKYLSKIR